jgi:hypothetical protein
MEAGDFPISNAEIVAFITANGRNRLDNIKGDTTEWSPHKLDPGPRARVL